MTQRALISLALLATLVVPIGAQGPATKDGLRKERPGKKSSSDQTATPREGDVAPDFTLKDITGKKTVTLSELKGKPVVLYFGSCT